MNTLMAILSQLFWGVTVGALSGSFAFIGKLLGTAGAVAGGGYAIRRWRKRRKGLRPEL